MAAILALGVFGMIGAYAEDPAAEEEVVFGPGVSGWDNVRPGFALMEDVSAGTSPDSAVVLWEAFLGGAGKTSDPDSFISQYKANPKTATVKWEAWRVGSATDTSDNDPITVKNDEAGAINTSRAYLKINESTDKTDVTLVLKQDSGKDWYSWIRVKLTVTVSGVEKESAPIYVEFRDPRKLGAALYKASEELAKKDRHTDAYLSNLRTVYNAATAAANTKLTQAEVNNWETTVKNAIDGLKADGTSVARIYKLTGWEWLDKIFPDNVLRVFWGIKDIFGPVVDFFGQVGKMISNIMPLFTMLGSLLGL